MQSALVFVSAGMGDALLMIPFLKALRLQAGNIIGVFTSPYASEELFEGTQLFDQTKRFGSKRHLAAFAFQNIQRFDKAFLNVFAGSISNILLAGLTSKNTVLNFRGNKNRLLACAHFHVSLPEPGLHDAIQNLRLIAPGATNRDLTEQAMRLPGKNTTIMKPENPYMVVQICSANNRAQHKNWPADYWIQWLGDVVESFPSFQFLLVGESREESIAKDIISRQIPRVVSLVGKTSVRDVMELIAASKLYVGLDSGLMHLAVALGRPTFTLWGASNPNQYGYEMMNPLRHRVVSSWPVCGPCDSWITPNRTRVSSPALCPDFRCMKALTPQIVYREFVDFVQKLSTDEWH